MMASERRVDDLLTLLPDDLLKEILLSIPVESLISLASTCNKWRDYLTDYNFARMHLDRWRSRYGILYSSIGQYRGFAYLPIFDGLANQIILPILKRGNDYNYIRVLDSCDGLLLIVCDHVELVVCNPLMRSSYKLLQLPPTRMSSCHWNMVYDASIKRYKIIGITRQKWITKNGVRGRQFYILELRRSSESESESEWKEVFVCDDMLGGGDFGGRVQKSVLVDEKLGKKKKKLYYLTCNINRCPGEEVRTSVIYIDIETHQVKAVEAAACSSMSILGWSSWVGSSSTGRFYMSDYANQGEEFNSFVLEDLHSPFWKRRCISARNVGGHKGIRPLAVVHDNNNDEEEEKILYLINGKIYEYRTDRGPWIEASNNTEHQLCSVYYHGNSYVPHLLSLIRI